MTFSSQFWRSEFISRNYEKKSLNSGFIIRNCEFIITILRNCQNWEMWTCNCRKKRIHNCEVTIFYWVAEMGFHKFCKPLKKKNSAFKLFKVCTEATALHHVRRLDDEFPPSLHACFSFIRQSCGRPSIHEEWRPNVQSIDCLHPWTSFLEIALTQAPSHNEEQTLRSFICRITGPGIFLQTSVRVFHPQALENEIMESFQYLPCQTEHNGLISGVAAQ